MKKTEYQIITSGDTTPERAAKQLDDRMSDMLKKGREPFGTISVITPTPNHNIYTLMHGVIRVREGEQ